MTKKPQTRLTRFELQLMDVLWRMGEGSVREVQEALPEKSRPAYTTVQTMLNRLEEKGALRRTRKIGNAFLFAPTLERRKAHQRLIDDFLEMFGGSATPLVSHLVESGKLSLEDVRAIEERLGRGEEESE